MWGYDISELSDFTEITLDYRKSGWILDAGCGSLVFNAGTYARYSQRPVLMLDQSIQMLRAAKSRLIGLCGEVPSNVVFLQGDILHLPFTPQSFNTVFSLSVLHVIDNMHLMIGELWKVLKQEGNLSLTSLMLGRSVGDKYLRYLHQSGGVASPRNLRQILGVFSDLRIPTDHYVRGNMVFIHSG
jgi:ubiquinone/menaquinone biosynthesis C-methylase UbiE